MGMHIGVAGSALLYWCGLNEIPSVAAKPCVRSKGYFHRRCREQARRPTLLRKGFPAPLCSETNTTSGTGPIHSILSPISAAILNFKERILTADENGSGHAAEWSYRVT